MKKPTLLLIILTTIADAAVAGPIADPADQPEFPKIISQPENQLVSLGSSATFTVTAQNADAWQWLCNGKPLNGATNGSFTLQNVRVTDVALYSCDVFKGLEIVSTRAATLMAFTSSTDPATGVDPVVVYSYPVSGSGSQGSCPGQYIGYVNYFKQSGWGWSPDTNNNTIFTATDTNRTNTKVQFAGAYGDSGCNVHSVTIPNIPYSPLYQFAIYFTNNVPTNAYGITLSGFNP